MIEAVKARVKKDVNDVVSAVKSITVQEEAPPKPPPKETWTHNLFTSSCKDFCFCLYACLCPIAATLYSREFRHSGDVSVRVPFWEVVLACFCVCCLDDDNDCCCQEREEVRETVNIREKETCRGRCCENCIKPCFCWGCTLTQQRIELITHFEESHE